MPSHRQRVTKIKTELAELRPPKHNEVFSTGELLACLASVDLGVRARKLLEVAVCVYEAGKHQATTQVNHLGARVG
jgi:hypothetical protein